MVRYTIREEPEFRTSIDELEKAFTRVREIKEGLSSHLSRNPKRFSPIEGLLGFYSLKTNVWNIDDVPTVQVVYYVNEEDQEVWLLMLQVLAQID